MNRTVGLGSYEPDHQNKWIGSFEEDHAMCSYEGEAERSGRQVIGKRHRILAQAQRQESQDRRKRII